MLKHLFTLLLSVAMIPLHAQSQVDDVNLYDLSLEELMNVKIVSASRSEEKAFDAPLSSYAITSNEIIQSGASSIPDALRLCPGLFVKEMANGVYEVSIRGLDNLPSHQYMNNNKLILVMINNRPVFDYLNGGTLWQNLPVDIVDVEKIEVVLGPSAPLYGPNAVTGVINIITRNVTGKGFAAVGNVQGGTPDSYIGQAWIGYSGNDKIDFSASINYNNRKRGTVDFYDLGKREYVTNIDEITNPAFQDPEFKKGFFPYTDLAIEKLAGNFGVKYTPTSDVQFDFSGGLMDNTAFYGSSVLTTQSYMSNRSVYGMVKGEVNNFSFMGSILNGRQSLLGNINPYQYDYRNFDGYVDYNLTILKKLNLRPALSLQSSTVDDEPYTVEKGEVGVFNDNATMHNYAASLKADYTIGKLRLIGAVRGDKFRYPNDVYISYQGLINYKLNDKNNFRAVIAKSNSGSFISETYLNNSRLIPADENNPFTTEVNLLGNKNRSLAENRLLEIGYRAQILSNLQFDVAVFRQNIGGFVANITQAPDVDFAEGKVTIDMIISDLDLKAVQSGLTLAVNWVTFENKINIKPFITLQRTEWLNYSPYFISPEANPDYSTKLQNDIHSKATPDVFGGFYANYTPADKWNINLNGYYMSEFEIFTGSTSQYQTPPYNEYPASKIDGKFILNAKVAYQLTKHINVFANARNAFNNDSREYFGTDKIGAMYLGGLNFNW